MSQGNGSDIAAAICQIPSGLFVLTCAHDGARSGVLARWVQRCSQEPPQLMVAIAAGLPVEPLIRDSRAFGLCQIDSEDRLLRKMFATPPERGEDPFVLLASHAAPSGSPVIDRALSYLDCRVVRHVDLGTDHRLYVGEICAGELMNKSARPAIEVGGNGHFWFDGSGPADTGA